MTGGPDEHCPNITVCPGRRESVSTPYPFPAVAPSTLLRWYNARLHTQDKRASFASSPFPILPPVYRAQEEETRYSREKKRLLEISQRETLFSSFTIVEGIDSYIITYFSNRQDILCFRIFIRNITDPTES